MSLFIMGMLVSTLALTAITIFKPDFLLFHTKKKIQALAWQEGFDSGTKLQREADIHAKAVGEPFGKAIQMNPYAIDALGSDR